MFWNGSHYYVSSLLSGLLTSAYIISQFPGGPKGDRAVPNEMKCLFITHFVELVSSKLVSVIV